MSKWFVRKTRTRSPSRLSFFSTSGDSQPFLAAIFLTVAIIVLGPVCARADVDDVKLAGDDQADRTASRLWPFGRPVVVKRDRGDVAPVSPAAPQAVPGSNTLGPTGRIWMQQTTSGVRAWTGIACDSTCTKIVAVAGTDFVYTSTDSGATWTQQTGSLIAGYQGVASSSDGTKLVAVATALDIQTSDDSGVPGRTRRGPARRRGGGRPATRPAPRWPRSSLSGSSILRQTAASAGWRALSLARGCASRRRVTERNSRQPMTVLVAYGLRPIAG